MDFNIEILGLVAAVLTTYAFVPQVLKVRRTKEVEDLSLSMYLIFLLGIFLWFAYGYLKDSISIMLANIVTGFLVMSLIYFKFKYSKK